MVIFRFNPRTHEGCDLVLGLGFLRAQRFNPRTHEGCDRYSTTNSFSIPMFQSTHPRGVRLELAVFIIAAIFSFQSTHPRGVRHQHGKPFLEIRRFNPRTHEGCDFLSEHDSCMSDCFNPRTHEGCDYNTLKSPATGSKFQSTHPRGVRLHILQNTEY